MASGGYPPKSKSRRRSGYWPCVSPQTVIGDSKSKNVGCSINILLEVFIKYFISISVKLTSLFGVLYFEEINLYYMKKNIFTL